MTGKPSKNPPTKKQPTRAIIVRNKRARFDYFLKETLETGIILQGTEVKSLRLGKVSLSESYANIENEGLYLLNATIQEYPYAHQFNHTPTRPRQLLIKKKEYKKLCGAIQKKGLTLVPVCLYFNARGLIKCEIALAVGKKQHDKRETEKTRSWDRQKNRLLKKNQ